MPISIKEILVGNFGRPTIQRGRGVWEANRVVHIAIDLEKHSISGIVRGSNSERYSVSIVLSLDTRKRSMRAVSSCECPVGDQCKHGAALLLAGSEKHFDHWERLLNGLTNPASGDKEEAVQPIDIKDYLDPKAADWIKRFALPAPRTEPPPQFCRYEVNYSHATKAGTCTVTVTVPGDPEAYSARLRTPFHFDFSSHLPAVVGEPDASLIAKIGQWTDPERYGGTRRLLAGTRGAEILEDVVATGRAFLGDGAEPLMPGPPVTMETTWKATKNGIFRFEASAPKKHIPGLHLPIYIDLAAHKCGRLVYSDSPELIDVFQAAPTLQPEAAHALREKLLQLGVTSERLLPPKFELEIVKELPVLKVNITRLPTEKNRLKSRVKPDRALTVAKLAVTYGKETYPIDPAYPDVTNKMMRTFDGEKCTLHLRLAREEAKAVERFRRMGFVPAHRSEKLNREERFQAYGSYVFDPVDAPVLHASDTEFLNFVRKEIPVLEEEGFAVDIEGGLKFVPEEEIQWEVSTFMEREDWWKVELGIVVEGEKLPLVPILITALETTDFRDASGLAEVADDTKILVKIKTGKLAEIPAWRVKPIIFALFKLFGPAEEWTENLGLSRARVLELDAFEHSAVNADFSWKEPEQNRKLREKIRAFSKIEQKAAPSLLQGELRPYQLAGLSWLNFLQEFGFGGVLADDMGLGKTVQTISHILAEKEAGRLDKPVLIVAPTSTLPNWRHEFEKFAPSLQVALFHGADRKQRLESLAENEVVLTSYALLTRDRERLSKEEFHLVVLDEAQNIKNPASAVFGASTRLNARHRICLSGTPVENNLEELWAIFRFAAPGLLPPIPEFRKIFRYPIEREGDKNAKSLLTNRIKPFLLRRTKEQVATELPEKTEIIELIELEGDQRDLYEILRVSMNTKVKDLLEKKGLNRSRFEVLEALLRLRQVCCDPRLIRSEGFKKVERSAKLERLSEMLEELISEGRAVLLFSQFTSMLDLIEPVLKSRGIEWARISGDTVDRETPVRRFQDGEVPVFLISLKAGGTGLNLTRADAVIHFDPWWNPAVERQATDRAHRIGQTKRVFVYKLIAENTVEQKIVTLQERKSQLAGAILSDDTKLVSTLTAEDLAWIFS